MEICQLSCQFSGIPLRLKFNHAPSKLALGSLQLPAFLPRASAFSSSRNENLVLESRNRMFILGMGFVGQFFAQELEKEGWVISGTCTSIKKKKELEERGFDVHLFYANKPDLSTLNTLRCCTHLLLSIPPVVGVGDPMLQHGELLRRTLMNGNLQWLCYLSSTSVYGDCGGACVDEEYATSPTNEVAKLRLAAEEGWLNLGCDLGLASQVFRLGGIYGPGRSAVDTIIKQKPLTENQKKRESRRYTSRVHVEDICQALKASIRKPSSRRIYNIVDDDPAPREEVFEYALGLVKKKWSSPISENVSTERSGSESYMQKGNTRGEKRVSNARVKKELGVQLLHPSYRSGLQSIVDQIENPFQRAVHKVYEW